MSIISWHEMIEISKNMVEACHFAWLATLRTETITISLRGLMRSIWPAFSAAAFVHGLTRVCLHGMPHKSGEIIWLSKCKIFHLHFLSFWIFSARCANLFPMEKRPTPTRLAHLLLLAVATVCCTGFVGGIVRIRPQPSSDLHVDEGAKCQ